MRSCGEMPENAPDSDCGYQPGSRSARRAGHREEGDKDLGNGTDDGKTTVKLAARLVRNGAAAEETAEREILREHRLEIVVNERTIARLVCTGEDLENLVVGRLITEQMIAGAEDIEGLYLCESGNRARVFLKENIKLCAAQTEEPTCCTDNLVLLEPADKRIRSQYGSIRQTEYEPLEPGVWKPEWIFGLTDAFAEDFRLHKRTGGIHACMLGREGSVLYQTEDIGRHNAMDKAIGYASRMGIAPERCMLFTTGRVPTDMVRKAVASRIPVLVSKAVPTLEAVEMAQRYGLVLICRAWPDSFEIYADGGLKQNE